MKILKYLFIGCAMLSLNGCSILSPVNVEPLHKYSLKGSPRVYPVKRSTSRILYVAPVDASSYFKSSQMVYINKKYQISYFTKNEWAEPPAKMLLPLIVKMLTDTRYFRAVVTQPVTGRYDYILFTEILDLQQDFTKDPSQYELTIRAQLFSASSDKAIRTKIIHASVPVNGSSLYDGVRAANQALARALKQLAVFSTKGL